MTTALETRDLSKVFYGLKSLADRKGYAVHKLSMTVEEGDIYGFLGPNGSGKTTTIRMILGLVRPSLGTAKVFGQDVRKDRLKAVSMCGSMIDVPSFYPYMSARNNLRLYGGLYGGVDSGRVDEVLDVVGLASRANSRVKTFSHGMRQRLGFARAILMKPRLLLLDEPTNGLDPEGNWDIIQAIRRLNRDEGITVLLSSHLLSEIEQLCNRTCILRQGLNLYEGSVKELLTEKGCVDVSTDDNERARSIFESEGLEMLSASLDEKRITVRCEDPARLSRMLHDNDIAVTHLSLRTRNLRDVFLKFMHDEDESERNGVSVTNNERKQ
ncbi:MAG: ABC transporter ATP-binding protein [Planctomycetota bacterium]|nr:ABC transporter ATP-binding protein [Planctomycetota bacterium]